MVDDDSTVERYKLLEERRCIINSGVKYTSCKFLLVMICWETRPSEPYFSEIFRAPWPFSLILPPISSLSVLILLPFLPLRCSLHFKTYDSFGSLHL